MVRWSGDQVFRWSGGQVVSWPGGQVIRWPGDQVASDITMIGIPVKSINLTQNQRIQPGLVDLGILYHLSLSSGHRSGDQVADLT